MQRDAEREAAADQILERFANESLTLPPPPQKKKSKKPQPTNQTKKTSPVENSPIKIAQTNIQYQPLPDTVAPPNSPCTRRCNKNLLSLASRTGLCPSACRSRRSTHSSPAPCSHCPATCLTGASSTPCSSACTCRRCSTHRRRTPLRPRECRCHRRGPTAGSS